MLTERRIVKPGRDTLRLQLVEITLLLELLMMFSDSTCQQLLDRLNLQQPHSFPQQAVSIGTIFTSITTPLPWQLSLSNKEKATISKPIMPTGKATAISE